MPRGASDAFAVASASAAASSGANAVYALSRAYTATSAQMNALSAGSVRSSACSSADRDAQSRRARLDRTRGVDAYRA